jgi:DNA polymerase III delta prime subunit
MIKPFHTIHRIQISEGGKAAILQLACGDLRRVLNLLQSSHMSYPEITEEVSTVRANNCYFALLFFTVFQV